MSIVGDKRSVRPKEAVTDENIKKVHKIILNDRKMKLIEIGEILKITNERSAEWTERNKPNPKRGKTQQSAGISIMGCA
jgi:hypothetical protein